MATHSSVLAWRIPGMGEPCGLPSLGSHRVGHDLAAAAAAGNCGWHCWLRTRLPCRRHEMRGQSLGQEDALEEEMATLSSALAWDREAWRATVPKGLS